MNNDLETVIAGIRVLQNGANVHTANKAVSYLRMLSKPMWGTEERSPQRIKMFENHLSNCKQAVKDKSLSALRILMRRWF